MKMRSDGNRERVAVREEKFGPRVLRKRPLAALSDPARAGVLRERGAAAQAAPVGFCTFCSLGKERHGCFDRVVRAWSVVTGEHLSPAAQKRG